MRFLAVAALLVLSLGGCWFATQYVASALAYAPPLGPPWATLGEERLYAPWQWIVWARLYAPRAPILFRNAGAITTASALAGAGVAAMASLRRKPSANSRAHGSSRWATTAEMKRAGLLQGAGVVLCQTNDAEFRTTLDSSGRPRTSCTRLGALVRHDGPEHVFCFAPTRSGKGVGLVIPTLLSWPHSVLVYDIKKENWALTAGWRRQFSRTWRFEPTSIDSVRFNPLLEIRKGLSEVRDTQNVADILVDPTGEKETRDHWQTAAHALLCGAILHVLYAEGDKTLSGVAIGRPDVSELSVQLSESSEPPTWPRPERAGPLAKPPPLAAGPRVRSELMTGAVRTEVSDGHGPVASHALDTPMTGESGPGSDSHRPGKAWHPAGKRMALASVGVGALAAALVIARIHSSREGGTVGVLPVARPTPGAAPAGSDFGLGASPPLSISEAVRAPEAPAEPVGIPMLAAPTEPGMTKAASARADGGAAGPALSKATPAPRPALRSPSAKASVPDDGRDELYVPAVTR
ncbi:MAG: type IV secretory system conjugative DNA transfer family protein [Myxococcota bacterium]|nr:type IV secretory system conjugative DNA transfer family protein [Myxococcota bacterium]